MYLGKVVEIADTNELFSRPQHPYTEALLSAVPVADPDFVRERIRLEGDVPNPGSPPSGCPFHPRCAYATSQCKAEVPALRQTSLGHSRLPSDRGTRSSGRPDLSGRTAPRAFSSMSRELLRHPPLRRAPSTEAPEAFGRGYRAPWSGRITRLRAPGLLRPMVSIPAC